MRARVIVALGQAQIDPVSRHLLGGDVDLLCAPDTAQRVLAIMLARSSRLAGVEESSREAERLRQMNEEVARIAEALARLAERGPATPGENVVSDRRPRSEEHTSELQSLMRTSYAVFCLQKK